MNIADLHRRVSVDSDFKFILNDFPNSICAYSLRKLRDNYNGFAIRVRRSSDNSVEDIGFVNNRIDLQSLINFVGSSDGHIVIWYDQSGNNINLFQTLGTDQPLIVSSGVVFISNNTPTINFNGTSQFLRSDISNILRNVSSASLITVRQFNTLPTGERPILRVNSGGIFTIARAGIFGGIVTNNKLTSGGRRLNSDSFQNVTSIVDDNLNLTIQSSYIDYQNRTFSQYINSNLDGNRNDFQTSGNTSDTSDSLFVGRNTVTGPFFYNGKISEIIIYQFSQIQNRINLEQNIKNYYAIF